MLLIAIYIGDWVRTRNSVDEVVQGELSNDIASTDTMDDGWSTYIHTILRSGMPAVATSMVSGSSYWLVSNMQKQQMQHESKYRQTHGYTPATPSTSVPRRVSRLHLPARKLVRLDPTNRSSFLFGRKEMKAGSFCLCDEKISSRRLSTALFPIIYNLRLGRIWRIDFAPSENL